MRLLTQLRMGWAAARRETRLTARDSRVWAAWLVVLLLSALAVLAGLREVDNQRATIARLIEADRTERQTVLQAQTDWGGAAYYSFHLSFDAPSDFAFAALGRRDDTAWKHRVRMLALEGQIHERDTGNPALALVGRFDFAFFAAYVLPLVLIVLLYDLRASERMAGRHELLVATAGHAAPLWRWRAGLRAAGTWACAAVPLMVAGGVAGTSMPTLLAACGWLALYVGFWAVLCAASAAWQRPGEVILATLVALWALLAVLLPAGGRMAIDQAVPVPSGAQIVMTQREAVNSAWDLPKATTMAAFVARHPQWAANSKVERPFEWKWYYAFQQVGDQETEALSANYTADRLKRDRWAGRLALAAPPVLLGRKLQALARTDLQASLAYEGRLRAFHAELRAFYYPKLFGNTPFDAAALVGLPRFPADAAAGGRPAVARATQ